MDQKSGLKANQSVTYLVFDFNFTRRKFTCVQQLFVDFQVRSTSQESTRSVYAVAQIRSLDLPLSLFSASTNHLTSPSKSNRVRQVWT